MSWPIGYAAPDVAYEQSDGGCVRADGVRVTDEHGWLEVPAPLDADAVGEPFEIRVRVLVTPDARGEPFIYASEVRVGARRHETLQSLANTHGARWIAHLSRAVPAEIVRRSRPGPALAANPRATRDTAADEPAHGPSTLGADVTAPFRAVRPTDDGVPVAPGRRASGDG